MRRQICGKNCKKEIYYILIDEVQYAITKKELENPEDVKLYNVLNGLMRLQNVDIYVTGSNSNLLSQDVMTAFRGRTFKFRYFRCHLKNIMILSVEINRSVWIVCSLWARECRSFYHSSVMKKRLRPLKNTKDFFKKIIISKSNAKPWIDEDGIVHIGLYDFLLNQNSLEL